MKSRVCTTLALVLAASLSADALAHGGDPTLTSWIINTDGATGKSSSATLNPGLSQIPANVTEVRYTATDVYVRATDIPSYEIGPWGPNPNIATQQNHLWRIPRAPQVQTAAKTATGLGAIGVLVNGQVIYNARDANSYNNQNVWHSNAVHVEAISMDTALGHPDQSGTYHAHQHPISLSGQLQDNGLAASHVLGFAFDGFPIYGPYADIGGTITRMTSSYQLRNITQRTTLPDGTALAPNRYGPAVSPQYPLGYYIEDYVYVPGSGLLDQYNGANVVTHEYPGGTYAYFATVDANGNSAYPYLVGPQYYGILATDNITRSVSIPANAVAVPEPASACLLAPLAALLLRRRRSSI
jgi:hypothetical protein